MITSTECLAKFGDPTDDKQRLAFEQKWMTLWTPPPGIPAMPRRVYCHKYLLPLLHQWHDNVVDAKLQDEVRTWDGCYCIRPSKSNNLSLSRHSWGLAFDINASWNRYGQLPSMTPELVRCGTQSGLTWGGAWKKPDGMHFELKEFPINASTNDRE